MASLSIKQNYKKNNDYATSKYIFQMLTSFVDKSDIIYEPFYLNGSSKTYLNELGYNKVIHYNENFFENYNNYEYDIIISNPPFSIKKKVFQKLYDIDKKFIMIVPVSTITKLFIKEIFKNDIDKIQIIIPNRRLQFEKDGNVNKRCWFDCVFLCYKLNLNSSIVYL